MKKIFSDFDGTLTQNGLMSAVFFDLLSELKKKNLELVIVSGRSISWGHFLLTHFPLNVVIMEGGGVISIKEGDLIKDYPQVEEELLEKLSEVSNGIAALDGVVMSADSFGRMADRAVEFKHMHPDKVKVVEDYLTAHGLNFSYSNVHLNFWAGKISKYNAVKMLSQMQNFEIEDSYYFGDALNDQSMFKHFKNSVGVSNIKPFLDKMSHKPSTILEGDENAEINGVLNFITSKIQ